MFQNIYYKILSWKLCASQNLTGNYIWLLYYYQWILDNDSHFAGFFGWITWSWESWSMFLKGYHNVKSEIISMKSSFTIILKSIGQSCALLQIHDFFIIICSHLQKIGLLS